MKIVGLMLGAAVLSIGCGSAGESNEVVASASAAAVQPAADGLSEFERAHGIGPVKAKLNLGELDPALAATGNELFDAKCVACHKLDERYVGPALGSVLSSRTPEYVMNMILNPAEMTQKHPEAKKLLGEYMMQMPFQNVSEAEAKALVEYLRSVNK